MERRQLGDGLLNLTINEKNLKSEIETMPFWAALLTNFCDQRKESQE